MNEQKSMEGLAARRTALKVIRQVTEEGAYASLALDAALKTAACPARTGGWFPGWFTIRWIT